MEMLLTWLGISYDLLYFTSRTSANLVENDYSCCPGDAQVDSAEDHPTCCWPQSILPKILTVFTGGPSWAMNYTKHFTFTGSLCPQQTHELRISNYSHVTDLATTKASREQVVCQMLQLESGGTELRTEAILVQSKPLLTSLKCLIPICMVSLLSPMIIYLILLIPKDGRSYQKSFSKKP